MNDSERRLGFIGLGMMGQPMASLLVRAGYSLTVFDIAGEQTARFLRGATGAVGADNLEAFRDVAVAITMLPDSDAVEAVVRGDTGQAGLIDILSPGATVIDMSSSQPLRSRALAQELAERELFFLDAPVSGGVKRAVDGSLAIMIGGDRTQFERHYDLFEQLGRVITYVGEAGAGHAMKALNNYVSAAGLAATVEALLVGQKFGLDPTVMTDVLNSSTGRNNTTENKVKQYMLSGQFNSGFSLQLMTKDLVTAMNLGVLLDGDMDLGQAVLQVWLDAANELEPSADHTELYRYLQNIGIDAQ